MSVSLIVKVPYAKGSAAVGNVGYISRRIGVDKSINTKIALNANYIGTRPSVEKLGTHGLFSVYDDVNLNKTIEEISKLKCNVWMPIISMKREDAERLGYNNAKAWKSLLISKQPEIADAFKIPLTDLRWYAAFHDKDHHPHIHILVYSNSGGGFLSAKGYEKLKSCLTREMFKDDMYNLYEQKTDIREKLARKSAEKIDKIKSRISYNPDDEMKMLFNELADGMRNYKGKKVYSYLPKDQKKIVEKIFEKLQEDNDISKLYQEWCNIQSRIIGFYKEKELSFPKLTENMEFNKIRNQIISAADELERYDIKNDTDDFLIDDIISDLIYDICQMLTFHCEQENEQQFSRSIVDSRERIKMAIRKQDLGIKMEGY